MAETATNGSGERGKGAQLPPYTAFASFKSALAVLKEHVIPNRIDRSIWGNKFSGSVATQILTAFRFLGLIDQDGVPQPKLRKLVKSLNEDEWKGELDAVIRDGYSPIFSLDLEKATANEFAEKFRTSYGAEGETGRKCMTFFLHAAKEADVPVSAYLLTNVKSRSSASTKRKPRRRDTAGTGGSGGGSRDQLHNPPKVDPMTDTALEYKLVDLMKNDDVNDSERNAIWTLIQYLTRRSKNNGDVKS